MIKHQIIVHKPTYVHTPPPAHSHWQNPNLKRLTQEEYNDVLKEFPFIVGQYITLGVAPLLRLGGVAKVLSLELDASKLTYRGGIQHNEPMAMKIMQCSLDVQGKPWIRWDTKTGWRPLNYEEWQRLIETNNDKLQDYCKQWEEHTH